MRYLFIHQNFPGQFRHIIQALAREPANQVIGVGDAANIGTHPEQPPHIRVLSYEIQGQPQRQTHRYLRDFDSHILRGQSITRLLLDLRDRDGFQPDVIVVHPGWGEALFIRDVFPTARLVEYFEFYYQAVGADAGFDPEFPETYDDPWRLRIKNSTQLHALLDADQGIAPTQWQKSRYPASLQHKIEVIHEGVNTHRIQPDPQAWVELKAGKLCHGDEVVTYVARNLEPYRGFHTFMRSLPALQALRPQARIVIVGGDDVSYGARLAHGETWRQRYTAEVGARVDWSRVHFVGQITYPVFINLLQVSAVHVYLTYPFVLSWSMLESMSAGCLLIASDTAPVKEVVVDGHNGLLVDFFDPEGLAKKIAGALAAPEQYRAMRQAARQTIVEKYDLETVCLPKMRELIEGSLASAGARVQAMPNKKRK